MDVCNYNMRSARNGVCADTGQRVKESYASLRLAKELYKEEFFRSAKNPPKSLPDTITSLTEAINSSEKIKRAMDATIDVMRTAYAEGCFGKDSDDWSAAIALAKKESDEVGRTRDGFLQQRSELMKRQAPPTSGLPPDMDKIQREVETDTKGEKGQKAISACNAKYGITMTVKNGLDVARAYGAEKAKSWTDCVVDTMYPVKQ